MKIRLLLALMIACGTANAASYKCVDREGKVSFSFTPCQAWEGDSSFYSETAETNLADPVAESAEIVRRHNEAARIRGQRDTGRRQPSQLTIVPDSTSTMGRQKQIDDEIDRRRAAKRARIDAGLESAPVRPIIIKQQPRYEEPPRTNFTCRSNGFDNRLSCY